MKFKDIPIKICSFAPKDKPYILPTNTIYCPFCGKKLDEHE